MSAGNPRVPGAGGRMLWLPNTSTDADIQAGLDNDSYDGVSVEGGAAIAITADLTIPVGKILEGAYYGADLDDAAMAIFDLAAGMSILVSDGIIRHFAVEQDAASTVSAIIGSGSAIAEYVRVYSSDGAFHNEWAFDSGFQTVLNCTVLGLKGILAEGVDTSGGTVQISGNYIGCVSVAGFTARGIEINQSGVHCFNNRVYRGGYGFHITTTADNCYLYDNYASACTDSGFYSFGATYISIDNCYSIGNANGFEFDGVCNNWTVGTLYSSVNTTLGFRLHDFYNATVSALYSYDDTGIGITADDVSSCIFGDLYAYSSSSHGIYIQSTVDATFGSLIGEDCNGTACVYINNANLRLTIGTIKARSSSTEGVHISSRDLNVGSIYAISNAGEGVTVYGVDVNIGKIYALRNTKAGVSLGHNGVLTRGSIGLIDSDDNQAAGLEIGPSTVSDYTLGTLSLFSNSDEGLLEVADGDSDGVSIASIVVRENGSDGVNLKTTGTRNWIRNIVAEGNTSATQTVISSGWLSGEPYGEYYFSAPAATAITVGGTLQKALGTTTLTDSEDMTMPANNNASYSSGVPSSRTRKFNVTFDGDLEADAAELVQIGIYSAGLGGLLPQSIVADTLQATGERQPISCKGVIDLSDAGSVEVWATAATNGTEVTVRGCLNIEAKPSIH